MQIIFGFRKILAKYETTYIKGQTAWRHVDPRRIVQFSQHALKIELSVIICKDWPLSNHNNEPWKMKTQFGVFFYEFLIGLLRSKVGVYSTVDRPTWYQIVQIDFALNNGNITWFCKFFVIILTMKYGASTFCFPKLQLISNNSLI